jgi:hypothetical protein
MINLFQSHFAKNHFSSSFKKKKKRNRESVAGEKE